MGCVDSSIQTIELYSLLNEITKQTLRNAIAEDDLPALAELEAETNYPTTIELSQTGLLWTTLHFCCRFEAPKCLEYFLRKCYIIDPNEYLRLINHQTKDGSSCLHLCAMWNANRCFALLVRYGGLNLDLKNSIQKGIIGTARDYSRKKIVKALKVLKRLYNQVTPWNFQILEEPINYQQLSQQTFYDGLIEEVIKKGDNIKQVQVKECKASKQEKQLRKMKQKLEKERQQMYQKRLKIFKEKIQKQTVNQELISEAPEERVTEAEIVGKQEVDLQKSFKDKEQQLGNIKKAIDLLHLQSAYNKIIQEQDKVAKGRSADVLCDSFLQLKTRLLKLNAENNKVKQSVASSALKGQQHLLQNNQMAPSSGFNSKIQSLLQSENYSYATPPDLSQLENLPLDIQKKYIKAQKEGSFVDRQFPHTSQSLGSTDYQVRYKPFINSSVWLRPDSFLGKGYKLFDGIHPNDAKQGLLGVCYCLATISTLAADPEEIKKIFAFYDISLGFYVLRFFTGGKPNYVIVDDYFPCNSSSLQPLFSRPIGREVWVLLIEKAWAKLIGNYYAAEMMTPDQFMEDLTGYPTLGAFFKKKKDPLKDIIESLNLGYPVVLTSSGKKMDGIVSNHAYSLLRIHQLQDCRIYRLRNPWGRFEWNGRYGEQSSLWTADLKIKCDWVEGDDGIFFLSEAELLEAFEYYSIGFQEIGFNYSFVSLFSKHRENIFYKFSHKGGKMSIRFSQPFRRMVSHSDYRYSGLLFEVGRMEGDKVVFVSEGNQKCFFGQKSVYACNQVLTDYPAGDYFIRLRVEWQQEQKFNSGVFSVYTKQKIQIQRLKDEEGNMLWRKMLINFAQNKPLITLNQNVAYCMSWMRGQLVCYLELKNQAKCKSAKLSWQFDPDQMKNCIIINGIDSRIEVEATSAEAGLGIVDRLELGKSCSSGKIQIKPVKE